MSHQAVLPTGKLSPQWGAVERSGAGASEGPTVGAVLLPASPGTKPPVGPGPLTFLCVVGGWEGLTLRPLGLRTD